MEGLKGLEGLGGQVGREEGDLCDWRDGGG